MVVEGGGVQLGQVSEAIAFGACGLAQPAYSLSPPSTFAGEWACSPGQV